MTDLISDRDRLKQQLISNKPSPIGGSMSQPEENTVVVEATAPVAKTTLHDFIEGVNVVSFSPFVTVTLSPFEHAGLPDDVVLADGNTYSVSSPLRKASEGKSAGVVRESLGKVFQEIKQLFSGDLRYMGDVSDISDRLPSIAESIAGSLNAIILAPNAGEFAFSVASDSVKEDIPASLDAEEFEDGAAQVEANAVEFSITDFISVFVYPTVQEDNTIRFTVNINLVVPFLRSAQDIVKNLTVVNKIFTTFAEATVGAENFKLLYVLESDNLLAPNVSKMFADLQDESNSVYTVGVPYLRSAIEDGNDPFGLYPVGYTLSDAVESLFTYGGDVLLVIESLTSKK